MKNIEKQIINRLNKALNKYNLVIISKNNHNCKTSIPIDNILKKYCKTYVLVRIKDNTIIECYFTWDNIENLLLKHFRKYSLFDAINDSHNIINYCNNTPNVKPNKRTILIAKLYDEFMGLTDCFSYEELIINMDLMGI